MIFTLDPIPLWWCVGMDWTWFCVVGSVFGEIKSIKCLLYWLFFYLPRCKSFEILFFWNYLKWPFSKIKSRSHRKNKKKFERTPLLWCYLQSSLIFIIYSIHSSFNQNDRNDHMKLPNITIFDTKCRRCKCKSRPGTLYVQGGRKNKTHKTARKMLYSFIFLERKISLTSKMFYSLDPLYNHIVH